MLDHSCGPVPQAMFLIKQALFCVLYVTEILKIMEHTLIEGVLPHYVDLVLSYFCVKRNSLAIVSHASGDRALAIPDTGRPPS